MVYAPDSAVTAKIGGIADSFIDTIVVFTANSSQGLWFQLHLRGADTYVCRQMELHLGIALVVCEAFIRVRGHRWPFVSNRAAQAFGTEFVWVSPTFFIPGSLVLSLLCGLGRGLLTATMKKCQQKRENEQTVQLIPVKTKGALDWPMI
jgi:hypothetical protein